MNKKKALLVIANGIEEMETVVVFDILKRSGVDVTIAGLSEKENESARKMHIIADCTLSEAGDQYDAIILPGGGEGAKNLSESTYLLDIIKRMHKNNKIIAAICASPALVLAPTGILSGKRITCYPDMKDSLAEDIIFEDKDVVQDGNIITSKGPGTAPAFGIKLAETLVGRSIAETVKNKMLL
jgi:DJ-1 family protein